MSNLHVTDTTVPDLLKQLKSNNWLVPQFQREFVWSTSNVIDLIDSIFSARPIGMATLWEQEDNASFELAPLSIPDFDYSENKTKYIYFTEPHDYPSKVYAILDGRQRCTAIAMAFGGFHSDHGSYKYSGRYYLNVAEDNPVKRVVYIKETNVIKQGLNTDAACISKGLFPLSSNVEGEEILQQWMRYLQAIRDSQYYSDGQLPNDSELARRDAVIKNAFEGIVSTKLAIYTVPSSYDLADICEIFETLNTTGTKVSTVDLIHSWLYSDTINRPNGPVSLRDWIRDLGQRDGAIGWSSTADRPELIAQFVTACYVALEEKAEPRGVGKRLPSPIVSVKAGDLLATPEVHWRNIIKNEVYFATFIGDFQRVVAAGSFPWVSSPYPVTAAIYIALRWHHKFDNSESHLWGLSELDAIYKSFYWRNALTSRYDQGFLTQLGTDIRELKKVLSERQRFESSSQWASYADEWLDHYITDPLPSEDSLILSLTDNRPGGAIQKALMLPMMSMADKDLIDADIDIGFPTAEVVHMHHIYPKSWCQNNRHGELKDVLDPESSDRNWVNSVANLMPLSRQSNNMWKAKIPGQLLNEKMIEYDQSSSTLSRAFIDKKAFDILMQDAHDPKGFWLHRASIIARHLIRQTIVSL